MSNYNLRLDLSKLEGFGEITLTGQSGVPTECIVIPKTKNNIYTSQKTGARYLDLVCIETPESEYGSHMVTIQKTKEEQEAEKTSGERIRKPIVGNLKPFGQAATTNVETYKVAKEKKPEVKAKSAPQMQEDYSDDLPF